MEILVMLTFFCIGPFALVLFGYWLGRGAPGWPWAVVRRDGTQPGNVYANGRTAYYEREDEYKR